MIRRTLYALDGPKKHSQKNVSETGGTMDKVRLDNGTWMLYDRVDRDMYSVAGDFLDQVDAELAEDLEEER